MILVKNAYIVAMLIIELALFGCLGTEFSGSEGSISKMMPRASTGGEFAPAPDYAMRQDSLVQPQGKMVVKTGSAQVEVAAGTIKEKYDKFMALVLSSGGEITDSSYTGTENQKHYYITVRLSPEKFEGFGTKLSELGTVKSLNSNSEDITTQYIDITAKLENLKATRKRLLELYNYTNISISDILEIESELNRLQYEIDSTTQQKLHYERQSAKAMMTVTLVEPTPIVDKAVVDPLGQLFNIFLGALVFGLMLIAGLLGLGIPLVVVLAVLYFIVKKIFLKGQKAGEKQR